MPSKVSQGAFDLFNAVRGHTRGEAFKQGQIQGAKTLDLATRARLNRAKASKVDQETEDIRFNRNQFKEGRDAGFNSFSPQQRALAKKIRSSGTIPKTQQELDDLIGSLDLTDIVGAAQSGKPQAIPSAAQTGTGNEGLGPMDLLSSQNEGFGPVGPNEQQPKKTIITLEDLKRFGDVSQINRFAQLSRGGASIGPLVDLKKSQGPKDVSNQILSKALEFTLPGIDLNDPQALTKAAQQARGIGQALTNPGQIQVPPFGTQATPEVQPEPESNSLVDRVFDFGKEKGRDIVDSLTDQFSSGKEALARDLERQRLNQGVQEQIEQLREH